MKKYSITKEQCQNSIDSNGNVCSYCGGVLTPIETVDNLDNPTYWIGCECCERFDGGVKPLVYKIAEKMVDNGFIKYSYEKEPPKENKEKYSYWKRIQTSGATRVVLDVLRFQSELTEKAKQN